ncbi:MAG TPA: DUF1559 domain-containing protein [Pirellulales bacterium]|nr:DUF1559 domain-containing protein [Pirellulales bacterium]
MIRDAEIRDGRSNTYLLGEKYLDSTQYATGNASNDNQDLYVGYDRDTLRLVHPFYPPMVDTPGVGDELAFGSAHPAAFNAALCDGSARSISYAIDAETHRRLGNRKDHGAVNLDVQ